MLISSATLFRDWSKVAQRVPPPRNGLEPKVLLELRSAIDASAYRGHRRSPASVGKERLQQYTDGLVSLSDTFRNLPSGVTIALVDNTVPSESEVPGAIRGCLPGATEYWCGEINRFGKLNKGCGDVEVWRHFRHRYAQYDFIVRFEPRMTLVDESFVTELASCHANRFWDAGDEQVLTGYFSVESSLILDFSRKVSLLWMAYRPVSLESSLARYLRAHGITPNGDSGRALRYDPARRRYESY